MLSALKEFQNKSNHCIPNSELCNLKGKNGCANLDVIVRCHKGILFRLANRNEYYNFVFFFKGPMITKKHQLKFIDSLRLNVKGGHGGNDKYID